MSLFKIVGNYYEDILDYFTREYKKIDQSYDPKKLELEYIKYQDNPDNSPRLRAFKEQFRKIFDISNDKIIKKTEIVKLLASTYMKLDRLSDSDASYWDSRASTYSQIRTIMWVMMIIILIVLAYLCKISLEGETDKITMYQTYITYITIFSIVYTIFLVFLTNINENIKMSGEYKDAHAHQFISFNLLMIPNVQFQLFFTAIGYLNVNNEIFYNRIIKKMQGSKTEQKKDADEAVCQPSTSTTIKNYVANKDPCKNKTNLNEIYDDLKNDITDYVFQFYNYGNGYTVLKKAVVKTSSNYMLKEVREVMSFYYYLINKKGDYDIEQNMKDNDRKILDKVLVNKLETMKIDHFISTSNNTEDRQQAITENEDASNNPVFNTKLQNLQHAIIYLGMFLYPLYNKEASSQTSAFYISMPQHISASETDSFKVSTKNYFGPKSGERYNEMLSMTNAAGPNDFKMLMAQFILQYQDYIMNVLNSMLLVIKGNDVFVLDESYIGAKVNIVFNLVPFVYTEPEFKEIYKHAFLKVLLPSIQTKLYASMGSSGNPSIENMLNFKTSLIVDSLAEELSNYNINIKENTGYVLSKIIKNNGDNVDDKMLTIYKNILKNLDNVIELKKSLKRANNKQDPKFVTSSEFNNRVNDIVLNDVISGLNVVYMNDLLNSFYSDVSSAIGTSNNTSNPINRTEQNIFYKKQRNFKVASVAIIMVYIIIAEIYIWYLLGWWRGAGDLAQAEKILPPGDKIAKLSLRTKQINHLIKCLIPLVMVFFICALLFSYQRKAMDAFEFNRDTIETNTSDLMNAITKLDTTLTEISLAAGNNSNTRIGDLKDITDNMKIEMFNDLLEIVDKYEKCNYIINISQTFLPFPYTEVTVDAFMIAACVLCFVYIFGQMNPMERLKKIKKLNKMKEDAMFTNDEEMRKLVDLERACNLEEIDMIAFTLKIIFFSFLFMFLIFYTVNIISSTGDFKNGLYNSAYFEESRCYNG